MRPNWLYLVQLFVAAMIAPILFDFLQGNTNAYQEAIIRKAANPELFLNELGFDRNTLLYYIPGLSPAVLLSYLIGFAFALKATAIATIGILTHSLSRLASALASEEVSPLLPMALLVSGGTHVLLGNHLVHNVVYYPTTVANALVLLVVANLIQRKYVWAIIQTVACLLFSVIHGTAIGIILILFTFFTETSPTIKRTRWALLLGILGFCSLFLQSEEIGSRAMTEARHIFMYIRSPGHFFLDYWNDRLASEQVHNIAYMALFCLICAGLFIRRLNDKILVAGSTFFISTICLIAVFNPQFMDTRIFYMSYPFRFSPLLLGLTYAFGAALITSIKNNRFLLLPTCVLFAFSSKAFGPPTFFLLLVILLVNIIPFEKIRLLKAVKGQPLLVGIVMSLLSCFIIILVPPIHLRTFFILLGVTISSYLIITQFINRSPSTVLAISALIAQLFLLTSGFYSSQPKPTKPIDEAWIETCAYIKENTETDSIIIIPPRGYYDFQGRSERAAYVSLKFIPRTTRQVVEWADRIKSLNSLPTDLNYEGMSNIVAFNNDGYVTLDREDFFDIAARYAHVDYCITTQSLLGLVPLFKSGEYSFYDLQNNE